MFDFQLFKSDIQPKHLDIEGLNQVANDMTKDSPMEEAKVIKSPVMDVNQRWNVLLDNISDREVCLFVYPYSQSLINATCTMPYLLMMDLVCYSCDENG